MKIHAESRNPKEIPVRKDPDNTQPIKDPIEPNPTIPETEKPIEKRLFIN